MRAYGGTTAKRTCLWSNSHSISKFETRAMKRKDLENADVKTTIRYKNKAGKTRFVGSSSLKSTQSYSQPGMFMTCCKSWSHYLWWLLRQYPRGFGMKLVYLHHLFVTEQKAALRDPKPVSWLCLFMFMCWCVCCVFLTDHAAIQVYQTSLLTAFAGLDATDVWVDCKMPDVVAYLRGRKGLRMPANWRAVFPTAM